MTEEEEAARAGGRFTGVGVSKPGLQFGGGAVGLTGYFGGRLRRMHENLKEYGVNLRVNLIRQSNKKIKKMSFIIN